MIINYLFDTNTWQSTNWSFAPDGSSATLSGTNDILSNIRAYIRPGEYYTIKYTLDDSIVGVNNYVQLRLNGQTGTQRPTPLARTTYTDIILAGNTAGGLEIIGNTTNAIKISDFTIYNHFNIKNDKYLVSQDSTITNFKNTHNQFVRDLRDSSVLNILSNPTMHHRIGGNEVPWQWDVDVTGRQDHQNGMEHYIRFGIEDGYTDVYFFNAIQGSSLPVADYQEVSQEVTSKLLPGKDYMAIFEFEATDAVTIEIQSLDVVPPTNLWSSVTNYTFGQIVNYAGDKWKCLIANTNISPTGNPTYWLLMNDPPTLIDLTDGTKKELFSISFTKADIQANFGKVQHYFYFRAGEVNGTEDFGWVRFVIKSNAPSYKLIDVDTGNPLPDNTLNIKRLSLVKGGIELFDAVNPHPFLENVRYNHDVDKQYWEITNGEELDRVIEPDGSVTVVYKWHKLGDSDVLYRQDLLDVTDKTYNILYKLESIDGIPVLTHPYIHYPVPDIGQWNELQGYEIGDIVIHNNLKWRCIQGNEISPCIDKNPSTFPEFWENLLWYVDYLVKDNFLEAQKAYYKEHIQLINPDGKTLTTSTGTHVFTDRATGRLYTFDPSVETPILMVTGLNPAANNTDATYIGDAFDKTHRHDGDHSLSINGTARILSLTINATTGALTPAWQPLPKPVPGQTFTNSDLFRFYEIFTNTDPIHNINMWHDAQGRHVVKDNEGNWWTLYVENGQLKFEWATKDITELRRLFQLYRQEHDKDGRHVLRSINTGIYTTISSNMSNMVYINNVIFNPLDDINQLLTAYNKSHDIQGRHFFTQFTANQYFSGAPALVAGVTYNSIDINTGTATNISPIKMNPVVYYPEVHPDRIKFDGTDFHQDIQGFAHTFYIAGNSAIGKSIYFGNVYPIQIIQSKSSPFTKYYVRGSYIQETNTSDAANSWFIKDYNPAYIDPDTGSTKCYEIIIENTVFNAQLTPTMELQSVAFSGGYPTLIQISTTIAYIVESGVLKLLTIN